MAQFTDGFSSFAAPDLEAARAFYRDVVGLDVGEVMGQLSLTLPGGARVFVYQKDDHQPAVFTVLNLVVGDVAASVDDLVGRGAAFEQYDVAALTALLHEEATLSMPPNDLWLQGHESIARWLLTLGVGCRGSRLVPVAACGGTPAFAQYRCGGAQPWALITLELEGDRITSMTSYLDVETLFPRFGLPMQLTG